MSRVLIFDNPGEQLSVITYFLEKKDYVVKTVFDTFQLFSELPVFKPDLLLLSTIPRSADVRDILKQLRSRLDTRALGILLCLNAPSGITEFNLYGADDYIEKPMNLAVLSEKIRSLLSWLPIRRKALGD